MSIASEAPSSGSLDKFMSSLQQALCNALRAGHVEMARNLLNQGCKLDPGIFFFCSWSTFDANVSDESRL
jgi:hypothetical protein